MSHSTMEAKTCATKPFSGPGTGYKTWFSMAMAMTSLASSRQRNVVSKFYACQC